MLKHAILKTRTCHLTLAPFPLYMRAGYHSDQNDQQRVQLSDAISSKVQTLGHARPYTLPQCLEAVLLSVFLDSATL